MKLPFSMLSNTRDSTVFIVIAIILSLSGESLAQCTKDTDCKGERVCYSGRCLFEEEAREALSKSKEKESSTREKPAPKQKADAISRKEAEDISGCSRDKGSTKVVRRLVKRGYTVGDVLRACRDYEVLKATYPEFIPFPPEMIETVAVAHKLGLVGDDRYWFVWYRHDRRMEITRAYNEAVIGGPKLKRAGWIMGGIGVGFVVLGGIFYGVGGSMGNNAMDDYQNCLIFAECKEHQETIDEANALMTAGHAFMGAGGALLIAGVPCLAVGYTRTSRWLPPKTLENAPANKVQELVAGNSVDSTVSMTITPTFGPNHAGIGLAGTF